MRPVPSRRHSMLGDASASPDVYAIATQTNWSQGGQWSYPSPITNRNQIITMMRWSQLEAAKEDPERAALHNDVAMKAAYNWSAPFGPGLPGLSPDQLFGVTLNGLSTAPLTLAKVQQIYAQWKIDTAARAAAAAPAAAPPAGDVLPALPAWAVPAAATAGVIGLVLLVSRAGSSS